MDEGERTNPGLRRAAVACALLASATALTMLFRFESARAGGDATREEATALPVVAARPAPSVVAETPVEPSAPVAEPEAAAEAVRVVVPDFVGMRLNVARREARSLGLRLRERDPYGERVDAESARWYRVSSQGIEPGTTLEPGARVPVRLRDASTSYGSGY